MHVCDSNDTFVRRNRFDSAYEIIGQNLTRPEHIYQIDARLEHTQTRIFGD